MAALVHDRLLARRLSPLAAGCEWEVLRLRSHGYVETTAPSYMLTIVERGADALVTGGEIGAEAADALKAEARRRAEAGDFFGHIAYVSLIASRPG